MAGMSSYDWYRSNLPGWGSSQMRFREPPMPAFQPLPSWSGWDYYRAHAINPDQNLYYTVMNRTRDLGPTGGGDLEQARVWQRRIYSGLVDLSQLLPQDIGMAAAYEAYRMWKHHRPVLFDPLLSAGPSGGMERVREGLVGLAIAEASRLWYYTSRPMDTYGLRDCLESAALTAFRISYNVLQEESFAGGYADPSRSPVDAYGDAYLNPGYTRGRRGSFNGGLPGRSPSPYLAPGGMPIPGRASSDSASMLGGSPYLGTTTSAYAGGLAPPAAGYPGGSYPGPGLAGSYSGGYPGGQYPGPLANMRAGVNTLLGGVTGTPGLGANVGPGSYNPAAAYGAPGYAGSGYSAGYGAGYPGGQYAAQPYAVPGGTAIPAPAGSTIVIKSRPRRHSHSHHHRSRSRDGRDYDRYERY